jgi:hypothetical protein
VTREYPSEQGEYDFSRVGFIRKEGHPPDAGFSQFSSHLHGLRRPNLGSCAGLAPTLALAQRAGRADLVAYTLTLKAIGGVNAHLLVPALVAGLVAGMVAGADSIEDMDPLRHGGMGRCSPGSGPPSTEGTFLRTFTFGPRPPARRRRLPVADRPRPRRP